MAGYGDFAYYYDELIEVVDYDSLCDYVCSLLADNGIGKGILLDVACGTGTLSLALSGRGYEVIGVDASEEMLSEAQNKMYEQGRNVLFLCQDMRELDLYGTVDACVCTLDGINHLLSEADVQKTLYRISLFMNKGGVFVFDVNTVHKHLNILADNTFVYDLDDIYCVWMNTLDEETLTVEMTLDIFERDDDAYYRISESFSERAYEEATLTRMLERAGFEVVNVLDWLTKDTVHSESEKAVFVCVKK